MANVSKRTAEHLEATHDELERLRAYVRELEKDKERLDWIRDLLKEKKGVDLSYHTSPNNFLVRTWQIKEIGRTLREAIDNAKEGQ